MRYETELDTSARTFTWTVAKDGYSLQEFVRAYSAAEAIEAGIPWVRERHGLVFGVRGKTLLSFKTGEEYAAWRREAFTIYRPADCGDMHRTFANTDSTGEAALVFVNRYGPIAKGVFPTFLDDFYAAQEQVRALLQLAKKGRVGGSKVESVLNQGRSHFLLRVSALANGKLVQHMEPDSLLGWMWLQAVRELTGSTWRPCEVCGTSFEVRDERQNRQRFCSARCRQKNFREMKRA